jgi:hypothetical protein
MAIYALGMRRSRAGLCGCHGQWRHQDKKMPNAIPLRLFFNIVVSLGDRYHRMFHAMCGNAISSEIVVSEWETKKLSGTRCEQDTT